MHIDPMAKKEVRIRINLNHYQARAVEALAALHRKQAATFLAEIIDAHLESYKTEGNNNNINQCA